MQPDMKKAWAEATPLSEHVSIIAPWANPDMSIIDGGRRQPPSLPMECFRSWKQWILDRAESRSAPPDYIAASLLSVAAGLIGNSRWVSPWEEWVEPPALWIACIGNPSSGKSPAIDVLLTHIRALEGELGPDFEDTLREYERDKEAARIKREDWQLEVKEAVNLGAQPPDLPTAAAEPERPARPRLVVSDTSVEQLARLLSQNAKGLTFHRDELSGWLGNMDKYGNGDRAFWIEAFGGRGYTVDRVKYGGDSIHIPFTTVSVVGGIQPDRLATLLMKGDDDGLASRFLMVWPNSVTPKRPTVGSDGGMLNKALSRLSDLVMLTNESGEQVFDGNKIARLSLAYVLVKLATCAICFTHFRLPCTSPQGYYLNDTQAKEYSVIICWHTVSGAGGIGEWHQNGTPTKK